MAATKNRQLAVVLIAPLVVWLGVQLLFTSPSVLSIVSSAVMLIGVAWGMIHMAVYWTLDEPH
jgi:hypothetical protein